jgi:hypothetical protein
VDGGVVGGDPDAAHALPAPARNPAGLFVFSFLRAPRRSPNSSLPFRRRNQSPGNRAAW